MDARDPITRVCREVERRVHFFAGRVNKVRRQLRGSDTDIVTNTALRSACVTLAKGINGVQFGARPVPIEEGDIGKVEATAIDWFSALAEVIGPALEDRHAKLASAPAVLAALGAIGHQRGRVSFDSKGRGADMEADFAVRCSMAIPYFFDVGWHNGRRVVDGGVLNNFRFEPSWRSSRMSGRVFLRFISAPRQSPSTALAR